MPGPSPGSFLQLPPSSFFRRTSSIPLILLMANLRIFRVIGFSIYDIIDYDKVLDLTRGSDIRELMYTRQIGYLKTIAIDRRFSGFGIASKLVKHCVETMARQGADLIISTAWKHAGVINIENVLKRNGFVQQKEIVNYWYEASINEKFMCPQCGNPCHCCCVIFVKC